MKPVTEQEKTLLPAVFNIFFFTIKSLILIFVLFTAVLIISQSSVSPISTRLLSTYAMEYAEHKIKPYRVYFPQPYKINLTEEKR